MRGYYFKSTRNSPPIAILKQCNYMPTFSSIKRWAKRKYGSSIHRRIRNRPPDRPLGGGDETTDGIGVNLFQKLAVAFWNAVRNVQVQWHQKRIVFIAVVTDLAESPIALRCIIAQRPQAGQFFHRQRFRRFKLFEVNRFHCGFPAFVSVDFNCLIVSRSGNGAPFMQPVQTPAPLNV